MRLDFQVHLTDDCNLKCIHCYMGDDSRGKYLTLKQFDHILNEVQAYKNFLAVELGSQTLVIVTVSAVGEV